MWDGTTIALVRHPVVKTIAEQLEYLMSMHQANIFRPLQATELSQIRVYADRWPETWKRHKDGRIFFAGTIYPVTYPGDIEHEFVWATWFDAEENAWDYGCFATDSLLRPHDEFACVSMGVAAATIQPAIPWPKIPPVRRERERTVPRQLLAVKR